jgi:hypothetical protein
MRAAMNLLIPAQANILQKLAVHTKSGKAGGSTTLTLTVSQHETKRVVNPDMK